MNEDIIPADAENPDDVDQLVRALTVMVKRAGGKVVLTHQDFVSTMGALIFDDPKPDGSIEVWVDETMSDPSIIGVTKQ